MATKKLSESVELEAAPVCSPFSSGPRKWADVMPQIQKKVAEGLNYQEAADALDVSYVLVNQLATQSYKSSIHTEELFEVQEKKRLGLID